MILGRSLTNRQIASVARCTTRSVQNIQSNLRCFGTTKAPLNWVGRPRTITPPMLSALLEHLLEKPDQYQDKIVVFLYNEFGVLLTTSTISRALKSVGWSKKASRCIAKEQNADLRNLYLYNLSAFQLYYLVYIDKSGCDSWIGFRQTG